MPVLRKRKTKRGSVAFGFIITVGILSLIAVALILSNPGVTVVQVPDNIPHYSGILARYAPSDALQVSYDNLTAIRAINGSVLSTGQFFQLDQPKVSLNLSAVGNRITIGLTTPNATVTIVTLDSGSFSNLSATLTGANPAVPTATSGNFTFYAAAGTLSGETQAYWLTLVPSDRALVYSTGANDALTGVEHIMNVYRGAYPSILNRTDVTRMLYAVNGTQGHVALGIQQFAGSVQTANATVISVDADHTSAYISYVARFSDASTASSHVSAVKAAYISAHQFFIYAENVKAVEIQPISQFKVAVGLVG